MVVMGYAHAPVLGILGVDGNPLNLTDCPLYDGEMQRILDALPERIQSFGITPYQVNKQKGELKYILLSQSRTANEFMLRFVVRSLAMLDRIKALAADLRRVFPPIAVITVNVQPIHMAIMEGDKEIFLTEQQHIIETFNGIPLAIRPKSFFQTNPLVAELLYATAAKWVKGLAPSSIWDLFCGVGGFGLHCLSKDVRLTGIEIEPEAIACAKNSAAQIGLFQQVSFKAFDAGLLEVDDEDLPDVIIVNPPRRGIGEQLCKLLNNSEVKNIVYSSCNPKTLVQDLIKLSEYRIVRVQGFDMFPHTDHFEVLVLLERIIIE